MRINRLILKNYRCFENLDIALHNRLTVIVGTNGSGKTSVLEGATVALGTFFTAFDGIRELRIAKKDVRLKTYSMGETDDVQPQYPVEIYAEGETDGREISWKRSLQSEEGRTTRGDAQKMTAVSEDYRKRLRDGDRTLVLPLIAYYGTGRLWDYHREKKSDVFTESSKTKGYIDSLGGTANLKLMMSWFRKKTVQMAQKIEGKSFSELPVVYKAMEACFERMTGNSNVQIAYNLDTNELDCHYTDSIGQRVSIPVSQLSDGYKGIVSLVADMAYRMALLNPQFGENIIQKTDGIVLIDEVDLHLHPAWQHTILSVLTNIFPEIQFIVTTHAPAVISSVRSENLFILKDNQAVDAASQVYGKDVNTILKEIMGVTERNPQISELFMQFYELLDQKHFDEAERVLDEIDRERDYHDKEVASCRVKLSLEKIRGGQV